MTRKTTRKTTKKVPRTATRAGVRPTSRTKSLGASDVPKEVSDAFRRVLQIAVLQEVMDQTRQAAFRDKFAKEVPGLFEPLQASEYSTLEIAVFRSFGVPPTDDGLRALYRKGVKDGFLKPVDIDEE